jgi:hypothetical protein
MKSSGSILMFQEVKDEPQKIKIRQITEFWKSRQLLISRPYFKNRQEYTFKRFSGLEKEVAVFHSFKIQHWTMRFKALHVVGKVSSGR